MGAYQKYRLWVINTETDAGLFLWINWKRLYPNLDVLVHLATEQAYIRSFQSYETENRFLGFGRMKWSEEKNILWTTKYRGEAEEKKSLNFYSTEIWAPDWNVVYDKGVLPDVFIRLYHYPQIPRIREGLVIALPRALYKKNSAKVDAALIALAKDIPYSSVRTLTRFWKPLWRIGNAVEDMNPHELQKIVEEIIPISSTQNPNAG